MCECLAYDDGSRHLCEACAPAWETREEEDEKLRAAIRVVLRGTGKTLVHTLTHLPPENQGCPMCAATIVLRNFAMKGWKA